MLYDPVIFEVPEVEKGGESAFEGGLVEKLFDPGGESSFPAAHQPFVDGPDHVLLLPNDDQNPCLGKSRLEAISNFLAAGFPLPPAQTVSVAGRLARELFMCQHRNQAFGNGQIDLRLEAGADCDSVECERVRLNEQVTQKMPVRPGC